jgi:DNA-binding XRE family transcriptional regulator
MNTSEKLIACREVLGMSRTQVAAAIGVTEASVRGYEAGKRFPRDPVKKKLADLFGVSVQYLFFDS